MSKNQLNIHKAENPSQYAKLANEGLMLGFPVKINGQAHRPDVGTGYHSTIKYFDKEHDHPHEVHGLARHLPLNPPDPKNTQIKFDTFKDRFGNDVKTITLHGNSAEKLKEHNAKFSHMGFPAKFEWTPHVSVDSDTWQRIKDSGAKTAHEAGIEFGPAELKHGPKTLKTYHHAPDTTEPVVPDESDFTAKIPAKPEKFANRIEKGAFKTAGAVLGMAGALAGATGNASQNNPKIHPSVIQNYKPAQYDHKKMLNAIAQVESSGGKNINHAAGGGPIHGTERAFGRYGIMPETIRETIKGHKDLFSKHGKAVSLKGDQLHNYMKDHKGLEDVIADRHLTHMEHVLGKDPSHLGYGWLNGISGTLKAQKNKEDIANHWHAVKVRDAYNKGS